MEGNIEPASILSHGPFNLLMGAMWATRLPHFSAMPVAIDKSIDAYQKYKKSATSGIRSRMFN